MKSLEYLRKEFMDKSFRDNLKNMKGDKCVNCTSEINIEYHHIVPLSVGGTNNVDNIVPLCCNCHDKAHISYDVLKDDGIRRAKTNGVKFGRKRSIELTQEVIHVL